MNLLKYIFFVNFYFVYTLQAQDAELKISLDKEEYLKGEPIYLLAVLENKSESDITINPFSAAYSSSDLEIFLYDRNDSIVKPAFNHFSLEGSKIILKSTEKAVDLIPIHSKFSNNPKEGIGIDLFYYSYLIAGKYSINLKTAYKRSGSGKSETKEIYSSPLTFKVIDPVNEEDLKIYNKLAELKTLIWGRQDSLREELKSLIDNHPNCGYSLNLFSDLFLITDPNDNINLSKYIEKMLRQFPDSYVTFNALYKRPEFEAYLSNKESKEKLSKTFIGLTELNDNYISIMIRNRKNDQNTFMIND